MRNQVQLRVRFAAEHSTWAIQWFAEPQVITRRFTNKRYETYGLLQRFLYAILPSKRNKADAINRTRDLKLISDWPQFDENLGDRMG